MDVSTLSTLLDLSKVVSVVGILIIIVWWLEKRMRGLEDKHDKEIDTLKSEYKVILATIKSESSENLKVIKAESAESLKAQREAHFQEKSEFFGGLKTVMAELVNELQTAEKTRIKMIETLNQIASFQNEVRQQLGKYDTDLIEIKERLKIFESFLKCDLSDEKGRR